MIVLDTNVVSEFMKANPDATVVNWLHQQPSDEIWTSSITIVEILYGLSILPDGKGGKEGGKEGGKGDAAAL